MTERHGAESTTPEPRGPRCAWCRRPITIQPIGRRRRYCRQSCRQRAYEARAIDRAKAWIGYREAELAAVRQDVTAVLELCEELDRGPSGPVARSIAAGLMPDLVRLRRRRPLPPRHRHPGPSSESIRWVRVTPGDALAELDAYLAGFGRPRRGGYPRA